MESKTRILFGSDAREPIMRGAHLVAKVVGTTLGKGGTNVGISYTNDKGQTYTRTIIHDGVNTASSVNLKDEAENFGAQILIEAAKKTVETVGDGTSVTMVLADAILTAAERVVAQNVNPMTLRSIIEDDVAVAVAYLEKQAKKLTTVEEMIQVATISGEEEHLGKIIGETVHALGDNGVITVDKSKTGETYVEKQEGMRWDRGMKIREFATDPDTNTAIIDDGYVLVTDYEIQNMQQLLPLLNEFVKHSKFLTIIAPDFGGDALPSLLVNKYQGNFLALALKAPGFGTNQQAYLQDIAILTGGTFVSSTMGRNLEEVTFKDLGKAKRVTATLTHSLVVGGNGTKEAISSRINELSSLLKETTNEFEKDKIKERLAKLTNGVAVVYAGGETDIEIKERYERALDAVLATRQAVKHGIVPGGEVVYLPLIPRMKSHIMRDALREPFYKLVSNAGFDPGQLLERLSNTKNGSGVDVTTGEVVDMVSSGIIDPVSVPINALKNAASVAVSLLTTNAWVGPYNEDKNKEGSTV